MNMMNRDERLLFGLLWAVAGASLLLLISVAGKATIADWMRGNFSLETFFLVLAVNLVGFHLVWLVFFMLLGLRRRFPSSSCS
jgi:hypothetical protein